MTEVTYSVTGMTCDHCVRAVKSEVEKIAGVASVTVDLGAGRLILASEEPVDPASVRAAVEEAGYEVTG
jgi:copper chaperone CopZ